jgi:hypothetical protein
MKTSKNAPAEDGGCRIDIQIESQGDVNIYNCTAPRPSEAPCPPPKDDHVCPPGAPGACVPVSLGSKPKQRRRCKLDKLLTNTRVPSALGASFFHLTRRYLAGKAAANALEERAFATLRRLSPHPIGESLGTIGTGAIFDTRCSSRCPFVEISYRGELI